MPIAVDGRQLIHAPELGCVAEEIDASRCWSSRGLKATEREDDICRPTDVGDFGFHVVKGWLMTTHQSMNPGHVGCCQAV